MTTPDFEGIMPYGMTFKPRAGSSYVNNPASSSSHISSHGLALPSAPVTVSASWTGAEECGVYLSRNGVLSQIGTIPAKSGGGSVLPSLPSSEDSRATTSTSTADQPGTEKEAQPAPSRLSPPQPSAPGGGVGDGTIGNGLDALAGHQARLNGGQYTGSDSVWPWTTGYRERFLAPGRCASAHHRFRRGPVDVDLLRVASPVRHGRSAQWSYRPSRHGQGGTGEAVRLNERPGESDVAGTYDFSGARRVAHAGVAA